MTGEPEQHHDQRQRHGLSGLENSWPEPTWLDALVEALLLVAPQPASPDDLAEAADVPAEAVEQSLARLGTAEHRGWLLVRHGGLVSLASAPRFAPQVRRFLGLERETRLSGAALETLALIAYRQPVSRPEIESVRGVDCSAVVATLHARGLVEQVGRGAGLGSPILYGTTATFLHHFGLRSLDDLPPLGDVSGQDAAALLDAALTSDSRRPEAAAPPSVRLQTKSGGPVGAADASAFSLETADAQEGAGNGRAP